ncbi:uncharacterized protein LOC124437481 [Xenia sp. Carnegie-2017]|uniref:uncharacterized protein LOC124437481 n=1 Tax=Xenia sp. Carnegie-2017 TaxID=2897299 RepID=UPI001F04BB71|nr:uncharacterized protein LOC124437481 [Xenia sp. Carnegie-2017]
MGAIPKGTKYIKTIPFFLKIAEFGVLLIAISTLGAFLDNLGSAINPWGGKGSLYFGMFAIVVSWIVVMVMVVVFVTGLHETVTVINWPLTVGVHEHGAMGCNAVNSLWCYVQHSSKIL